MSSPEDIFIFSYLRSGNVWLRFLIANLIFEKEEINSSNLNDYIGELALTNEKKLLKQKKPRIYCGHDYFDPRFKKVIYFPTCLSVALPSKVNLILDGVNCFFIFDILFVITEFKYSGNRYAFVVTVNVDFINLSPA